MVTRLTRFLMVVLLLSPTANNTAAAPPDRTRPGDQLSADNAQGPVGTSTPLSMTDGAENDDSYFTKTTTNNGTESWVSTTTEAKTDLPDTTDTLAMTTLEVPMTHSTTTLEVHTAPSTTTAEVDTAPSTTTAEVDTAPSTTTAEVDTTSSSSASPTVATTTAEVITTCTSTATTPTTPPPGNTSTTACVRGYTPVEPELRFSLSCEPLKNWTRMDEECAAALALPGFLLLQGSYREALASMTTTTTMTLGPQMTVAVAASRGRTKAESTKNSSLAKSDAPTRSDNATGEDSLEAAGLPTKTNADAPTTSDRPNATEEVALETTGVPTEEPSTVPTSSPCEPCFIVPLRMKRINGTVYWIGGFGLENEEVNEKDFQNMEAGTLEGNGTVGAFDLSTGRWSLVDEDHLFGCVYCELASRRDIRSPVYEGRGKLRANTSPSVTSRPDRVSDDARSISQVARVDTCPASSMEGEQWPATKTGVVALKRQLVALLSRECYAGPVATWSRVTRWAETWQPCDDDTVEGNSTAVVQDAAEALRNLTEYPILSTQLGEVVGIVGRVLDLGEGVLADNGVATRGILADLERILVDMVLEPGQDSTQVETALLSALVATPTSDAHPVVYSFRSPSQDHAPLQHISWDTPEGDLHFDNDTLLGVVLPGAATLAQQRVAFAVFSDDDAFPVRRLVDRVATRVVNVIRNGSDGGGLPPGQHVEIRFKSSSSTREGERRCVFWDFSVDAWSPDGCWLSSDESVDVCRCNHLTHFAMQVTGHPMHLSAANQLALDIISYVGCSLSLIGLACIATTAVLHPSWRHDLGNKILLHMSTALVINLAAFLLVAAVDVTPARVECVLVGVMLHYSLLACFSWMLVLSSLQLLRLLTVAGARTVPNLLLKIGIFAWGAPLFPVVTLLVWDPRFYAVDATERGFCYPSGTAFYTTVFAPIAIILVILVVIFVLIVSRIYSLCGWSDGIKIKRHGISDKTIAMRRLRTTVFLFFLFGLSWMFGLFVAYGIAFTYLFTITATLQGFVLFVFLLLLDKVTVRWRIFAQRKSYSVDNSTTAMSTENSSHMVMSRQAS